MLLKRNRNRSGNSMQPKDVECLSLRANPLTPKLGLERVPFMVKFISSCCNIRTLQLSTSLHCRIIQLLFLFSNNQEYYPQTLLKTYCRMQHLRRNTTFGRSLAESTDSTQKSESLGFSLFLYWIVNVGKGNVAWIWMCAV